MNIFHHVGKPAITGQNLQRVACNKLHMKPRHNSRKVAEVSVDTRRQQRFQCAVRRVAAVERGRRRRQRDDVVLTLALRQTAFDHGRQSASVGRRREVGAPPSTCAVARRRLDGRLTGDRVSDVVPPDELTWRGDGGGGGGRRSEDDALDDALFRQTRPRRLLRLRRRRPQARRRAERRSDPATADSALGLGRRRVGDAGSDVGVGRVDGGGALSTHGGGVVDSGDERRLDGRQCGRHGRRRRRVRR